MPPIINMLKNGPPTTLKNVIVTCNSAENNIFVHFNVLYVIVFICHLQFAGTTSHIKQFTSWEVLREHTPFRGIIKETLGFRRNYEFT